MKIKSWEESTKLTKSQSLRVLVNIPVAIICIVTSVINKNIAWGICGLQWLLIGLIEGISFKISNGDDYLADMQQEHIELQEGIINALLKETAMEIEIDKIKIPNNFTYPKPKKMKQKYIYYRKNHKFESQIIIDPNYNLLDGYTSYLIAKQCNRPSVIVKIRRISE